MKIVRWMWYENGGMYVMYEFVHVDGIYAAKKNIQ